MNRLLASRSMPLRHWLPLGILAVALLIFPFAAAPFGNSWVRMADMILLYVMMALGLNIVVGYAGLLDLGYIAFYAVGAYTAGLLASPHFTAFLESAAAFSPVFGQLLIDFFGPDVMKNGLHLSFWVILPLAAFVAALFGMLLGAPTLNLRGDYLAMVTLGFGEIIRIIINNFYSPINLTNGAQGISLIDDLRFLGVSLHGEPGSNATLQIGTYGMPSVNAYYFAFLTLCMVIITVTLRVQDSRLGRAFAAIREDEIAAKAMGINTRNVKLVAFALGASFGGVAGVLFATFQGFISPESFSLTESVAVLAMVVLGGVGHVPGVILGAVVLAGLPEILRHTATPLQQELLGHSFVDAEVLRQLLFGFSMLFIVLTRPAGLWPQRGSDGAANFRKKH